MISRNQRDALAKSQWALPAGQVIANPLGFLYSMNIDPLSQTGRESSGFLFSGRLLPRKGLQTSVSACLRGE